MRQAGVLSQVLPESEKWGIDAIHALVSAERDLGWGPDALLRLEAIVPPYAERMKALAVRLKLSNAQTERLVAWATTPGVAPTTTESDLAKRLYRSGRQPLLDRLRLSLASARGRAVAEGHEGDGALVEAGGFSRLLRFTEKWTPPQFPLKGADLQQAGIPAGPDMGKLLKLLEQEWVDANFVPDRGALLERAALYRSESN
jgi:tRNA nucleotidyltransferase/poly(A) polymerase